MPEPLTLHILVAGFPKCGFSNELPKDWPSNHRWVRSAEDMLAELDDKKKPCLRCLGPCKVEKR